MKRFTVLAAAGAAMLSACASGGATGASIPAAASVSTAPAGLAIGQCNSPGAAYAEIKYPAGWNERLEASVRNAEPADELLGGPTDNVSDLNTPPVSPPRVVYPSASQSRGVEGACDVILDTDRDGNPRNVAAACTSPEFVAAAESALSATRFPPRIENGRRVARRGIVYPLAFCLE